MFLVFFSSVLWSVHIENSIPLVWLEIIQYRQYWKLIRVEYHPAHAKKLVVARGS